MAQIVAAGKVFDLVMVVDPSGTPVDPGATGADRELVVTTYVAINAFLGASVGDTITLTQVIDVSGTPSTVATIWRNQTTAADLGSPPLAADVDLVGGDALTDAQLRASALSVAQSGTWNLNNVSGMVSLPTGAATSALQTTGNSSLAAIAVSTSSIDGKVLTDTQLRASAVPVSAAALPLPSGAATEATLATRASESTLAAINGKLSSLGQKTEANSVPVVIASDQPAIDVLGPLTDTELRATPVPVSLPALTAATEAFSTETGAFTIAAGAISYSVINVGAASFVFQGVTIPTAVFSISGAPLVAKTYPAITGDATGTTVIVQRTA